MLGAEPTEVLVLGAEPVEVLGEESVGAEPVEALVLGAEPVEGAGSSSSSQAEACSGQHQSSGRRLQNSSALDSTGECLSRSFTIRIFRNHLNDWG